MRIQIGYFALLREQTGLSQETYETDETTPRGVFKELRAHYGLSLELHQIKVAINDKFANIDQTLNDGDKLVFIPPVAGG